MQCPVGPLSELLLGSSKLYGSPQEGGHKHAHVPNPSRLLPALTKCNPFPHLKPQFSGRRRLVQSAAAFARRSSGDVGTRLPEWGGTVGSRVSTQRVVSNIPLGFYWDDLRPPSALWSTTTSLGVTCSARQPGPDRSLQPNVARRTTNGTMQAVSQGPYVGLEVSQGPYAGLEVSHVLCTRCRSMPPPPARARHVCYLHASSAQALPPLCPALEPRAQEPESQKRSPATLSACGALHPSQRLKSQSLKSAPPLLYRRVVPRTRAKGSIARVSRAPPFLLYRRIALGSWVLGVLGTKTIVGRVLGFLASSFVLCV